MPVLCPYCGYENPDRSTSCCKCNSRFSSISDHLQIEKKAPGITCPYCGYENPDRSTSCSKCNSRLSSISDQFQLEKKTSVLICTQCGYENPDRSVFCIGCGSRLTSDNAGPVPLARPANRLIIPPTERAMPGVLSTPALAPSPSSSLAATSLADLPAAPPVSSTPLPAVEVHRPTELAPLLETPQPPSRPQTSESQRVSPTRHHAFGRRGTSLHHQSWLIEGHQEDASALHKTILQQMLQRRYPGVTVAGGHLREPGAGSEGQSYLTIQSHQTSISVSIASYGSDLYVSRSTRVHSPVRGSRVIVLLLWLAVLGGGPFLLNTILFNSYSIYSTVGFVSAGFLSLNLFLEYVLAPLYAVLLGFFIWTFLRSWVNWSNTRDFWIYLRSRRLQDFQADDIILLEQAIDQVLHTSVVQVGIDSKHITPPAQGYLSQGHLLYYPSVHCF